VKAICADTGFLIGLYDPTDEFHSKAKKYFLDFFDSGPNHLLIPWPVVYETVSTRMVKNKSGMALLQGDWKRLSAQRRLDLISDGRYRDNVVDECFEELGKPQTHYRNLSAVDRVIRKMLSDKSLRVSALLTFNPKDFIDICRAVSCELPF
jgi:predicted nucleic acid-binding protein